MFYRIITSYKKTKVNNKGAAMIAVLCIMAIFVTLCLSMLLASSVLIFNAESRKAEEQCRVSAVTMSKELEYDLCQDKDSSLYQYVKNNLQPDQSSPWPYYNPDELGHGERSGVYRDFTMTGNDQGLGEITVRAYWEWERDGEIKDIVLYFSVTSSLKGSEHTIKTSYNLTTGLVEDDWTWDLNERS